jgi:hypothetical protein
MNKILELREKRAKAWETAKAFLDTKRGADGIVSAEDIQRRQSIRRVQESVLECNARSCR